MAHTENSVVVYVDDEEKELICQEAKKRRKSMSRYLLDLHLNQTVGKTTDAVKILHDRYIKNSPERLKSLQAERENNLREVRKANTESKSKKWHYLNTRDEICCYYHADGTQSLVSACGRNMITLQHHTEFRSRVNCLSCLRRINQETNKKGE